MEPGSCAVLSAWAHGLRGCFSSPRAPLTLAGAYFYLCEPSPAHNTQRAFFTLALFRKANYRNCPADGETADLGPTRYGFVNPIILSESSLRGGFNEPIESSQAWLVAKVVPGESQALILSFPMGMAAACNVCMCACGMRVAWWPTREWGHLLVRGGSRVHRPGVYVCVRPMGRGATAPACVPRVLARATPCPPDICL